MCNEIQTADFAIEIHGFGFFIQKNNYQFLLYILFAISI